jgi:cellulose synthase/poly-beta-1,6-N-acetylglucosamine synthase-like glycosyltransferase
MVLLYLAAGILERYGFMIYDMPCMKREKNTKLPLILPKCCIQLAMFNEDFVCERVIEASCALDWPKHLLEIQVLDDSTDKDISTKVDNCVTKMKENGYNCYILRRKDRKGYKAGALELGRKLTDAEFLALFDADFIPTSDFLMRTIPQFYNCKEDGELESIIDLALIQTRWGHLNAWCVN